MASKPKVNRKGKNKEVILTRDVEGGLIAKIRRILLCTYRSVPREVNLMD